MLFRRLTPDNQLNLHITKAREYWRSDRLDLALAAMTRALRVGVPPGPLFDFQRVIDAEVGARQAGRIHRIGEQLSIEANPRRWGAYWPQLLTTASESLHTVESTLDVRWSKPVLVTLIPEEDWVAFMRSRYGYCSERTDCHKICLPPSAAVDVATFARATLHEMTHAAVHQTAGEDVARWLNEGLAVTMEGGLAWPGRPLRMRLDTLSAGFERWDVDLGSPRSHLSYAGAGEFTADLLGRIGWRGVRHVLAQMRSGDTIERTLRRSFVLSLPRLESDWVKTGPAARESHA